MPSEVVSTGAVSEQGPGSEAPGVPTAAASRADGPGTTGVPGTGTPGGRADGRGVPAGKRPQQDRPEGAADEAAPSDVSGPGAPGGQAAFTTPSTVRVRRRLARLGAQRGVTMNPVLEPLIKTVRATHPKVDVRLIERAYEVAAHHHRHQKRKSGDPYITHPLAVATILAELGMQEATLAAALLHDTVEDTEYSLDELRADFGDEIAELVDGVTKLDKVKYGEATQAETVRKMVVAMARDIRVLVIKLCDRLHNMRTLRYLPAKAKREKKARETLEIFAPLAHRLGMNTIKWELEDLAFATLYPKRFDEIARLVSERAPRRDVYLQEVIEAVSGDLRESKLKATVRGRPKHYYSIYQKMIARNVGFDDIYDLIAVRVLVDSVRDCYAALGTIHARWNPVPGRFKDYIAMPKFNMYQSLHTTVIGPSGNPVELQIRTRAMHRRAEYGIAAHWKYKEDRNTSAGEAKSKGTADMQWLRQLIDWQQETKDPGEFLESLRFDLSVQEVFVFTPGGDVISLPQGATAVDFAYAVHTEVGHRTVGARINGRLVPLENELHNGETVEILTSKDPDAGPSRDWLNFVKSARARNKIRHWFTKERREAAIERGKDEIAKFMRKQELPVKRLFSGETIIALSRDLRYPDVDSLYAAVGERQVSAQSVVSKLVDSMGGLESHTEDIAESALPSKVATTRQRSGNPGVVVAGGDADVWARLSKCCTPVPGDDIVGFVTRGNGVSVHRQDCVNAASLDRERMVDVEWRPTEDSMFLVALHVEALDRSRLLSDITRVLSDQHVNILSATVQTSRDRVAQSRFTFEMADPTHLGSVLRSVRGVDGVYDVFRVRN
ncbi:GTP pyrophosphokinase [Nocardiopsis terrae]|uniref:GTP pyrophosphokinase n=2 Tax=Nocardiopsis terrae TaxID=372655 RepID=A0ABR9HK04_9ACTN|nr:GTP pyrophosphokinase [Nocardiopsis terrae]GHC88840.1 GTP pyrophosphokinase [Nocardiopsis terrae]